MKEARKVALVNIADYPREKYAGYWEIHVDDADPENDGYRWRAAVHSHKPIAWLWKGKRTNERPNVPQPEYPDPVPVKQGRYLKMSPADQAKVRAAQAEWREACGKVHAAHPQAVHLVEEKSGVAPTRDAADTAAQTWVKSAMEGLRYPKGAGTLASFALAGSPLLWDLLADFWRRLVAAPLLASLIAYATALRTSRMTAVRDAVDAGAGAGLIRIYSGTRPATGGSATTLGAELTCSDPSGTIASGVLTFSAITADSSADNSITATWGRVVDSTATFVLDFNVGTSGSDLNLNTTTITSGVNVAISSLVLTDGSS